MSVKLAKSQQIGESVKMPGPLHGYAIAKRARTLTDGRVKLAAGTLSGALDRMVDEGLVTVDSLRVLPEQKADTCSMSRVSPRGR